MKRQIRFGVFETNSSSEHSIALINLDTFRKWKSGEVMGRVKSMQQDNHCWGNFWSEMLSFEFTEDFEKASADNVNIFNLVIADHLRKNEEHKQRCLSYIPKIERELTKEEEKNLSEEEFDQYMEDKYMDSIHRFDEPTYDYYKDLYGNMKFEDFDKHFGKAESGMWMTFREFWDSWIEHNDCYSPFEHDDIDNNMHIIGKYFHS